MVELPIACTLTFDEIAQVKAQYRASAHLYQARAQIAGHEAAIELDGDKGPLGPFIRMMVAREAQCCAFLTFDLAETAAGFRLRIAAEAVTAEALASFVEMLFPGAVIAIA